MTKESKNKEELKMELKMEYTVRSCKAEDLTRLPYAHWNCMEFINYEFAEKYANALLREGRIVTIEKIEKEESEVAE